MNRILLIVTIFLVSLLSCKKETSCKKKTSSVFTTQKLTDLSENSPYYQDTVLVARCRFERETYQDDCLKCCPLPLCTGTTSLEIKNVSLQDIDLTLTLAGKGVFSFSIMKGDSLSITPVPDYCAANTWGTVKEIKYK
ncbi:MAG: hypothetical protein WCR52_14820 [Bacteroidota bacterium]